MGILMSEGSLGKDKTTDFPSRLYHLDVGVEWGGAGLLPSSHGLYLPPD